MKKIELKPEQIEDIYIASGSVNPKLAEGIARSMGTEVGKTENKKFSNGEMYVRLNESTRGKHFLAIQSLAECNGLTVNDSLLELMIMVDAAKRASASEITAVVPYLAYSRQDRKARGREPISAAVITRMLKGVGVDRMVSVDLHSAQTQATFDGPFDHLTAEPLITSALRGVIGDNSSEFVIVSPDGGRAKESEYYAGEFDLEVKHMLKSRDRRNPSEIRRPERIDDVDEKTVLVVDDMLDTARTLVSASESLKNSGAKKVMVSATHGLFSSPALEILADAPIDKIMVTDTVPQDESKEALGSRLEVLPSAQMIGRALIEIIRHGSVSSIFDDRNHH